MAASIASLSSRATVRIVGRLVLARDESSSYRRRGRLEAKHGRVAGAAATPYRMRWLPICQPDQRHERLCFDSGESFAE
jgi:hypothetical protein